MTRTHAEVLLERVRSYNAGREHERLHMKYERMAQDPFTFFRGSCHLFFEDLAREGFLDAPTVWACGDLHLENFGSYKGDNRLTYFDINDFDEGGLAPATWEIVRFLVSLWLASERAGADDAVAEGMEVEFLASYSRSLSSGKALWVERDTAGGLVRELLSEVRSRKDFLARRVTDRKGTPRLRLAPDRALAAPRSERERVMAFVEKYGRECDRAGFFRCLDVARRVAGTGSLGLRRYVVLVEGRGSPGDRYLIDLKQAIPSVLCEHAPCPQPAWDSEAARVVAIQARMQAVAPALLDAVTFDGSSWILKELQPSKNRLRLESQTRLSPLRKIVRTMGGVLAWDQLRASGRQGAAIADELQEFAREDRWKTEFIRWARDYRDRVHRDWKAFRGGWMDLVGSAR